MIFEKLEINCKQTHRYRLNDTDKQTQKRKKSKKSNTVVNVGPPDTEYLYYPLDEEGVTLKGSLLPASTR